MNERIEAAAKAMQPVTGPVEAHILAGAALAAADALITAWIDETVIVNDDGAWLDADELRAIIKGGRG